MYILFLILLTAIDQFSNDRLLLVFKQSTDNSLVTQQMEFLSKDSLGVTERDLKISIIKEHDPIRKKYHVADHQFTVILIGKDGGEKYRTHKVVAPQELFTIIDAMPMRMAEKKRKN